MIALKSPVSRLTVKPKMRKCKNGDCGKQFTPRFSFDKTCSIECKHKVAVEHVVLARLRRERKALAERKEALKTRSDYIKETQIVFNTYIRARDVGKPCICCGLPLTADAIGGGYDCGHYRSVGSAPHLRFNEFNAHGQRKQCNRWGSGRAVDYRIGLIKREGLPLVESLECDDLPAKWSIDDLKAIKATYRAKLRDLLKAQK